jgi:hypothetical protein
MNASRWVVVAGVVLAVVGALVWWRASAAREAARLTAEFTEAYGTQAADVSSTGVYAGIGGLIFGALVMLTGVVLTVMKAPANA